MQAIHIQPPASNDENKGGLLRVVLSSHPEGKTVSAETSQVEPGIDSGLAIELGEFIKTAAECDLLQLWWVLRTWRRAQANGQGVDFQDAAVLELMSDRGYQGAVAEGMLLEAFHKIVGLARQVADDGSCRQRFGAAFRQVVDAIPATFDEVEIAAEHRLPTLEFEGSPD